MVYPQLLGPISTEDDYSKDVAIVFNLGPVSSKKYGDAIIQGYFLCSLPFNQRPVMDFDDVDTNDPEIMRWAAAMGLTNTSNCQMQNINGGGSIMTKPSEGVGLFGRLIAFISDADTCLAQLKSNTFCEQPPILDVKQAFQIMIEVLKGKYTNSAQLPDLTHHQLRSVCQLAFSTRQHILQLFESSDSQFLFDALTNYFRFVISLLHAASAKSVKLSNEEYLFIRRQQILATPILELILLIKGIKLTSEVRNHRFFFMLCELLIDQRIFVGDTFSLEKAIEAGYENNIIIRTSERCTLQESIHKVIKKANSATKRMIELGKQLIDSFPEDPNVKNFILSLKHAWDGQLHGYQNRKINSLEAAGFCYYKVDLANYDEKLANYIPTLGTVFNNNNGPTETGIKQIFRTNSNKKSIVEKGILVLESNCSNLFGYQSLLGPSKTLSNSSTLPYVEVYTSALCFLMIQESGIRIHPKVLKTLEHLLSSNYTDGIFNFFTDRSIIPDEVDDTVLCILALYKCGGIGKDRVMSVAKMVAANVNKHGIIETYFPPRCGRENRIDLVVCTAALRLAYHTGQDDVMEKTENFVLDCLNCDEKIDGFLYFYFSRDALLYFLSEALKLSPRALEKFRSAVEKHLKQRFSQTEDPFSVVEMSMRILAAINLGFLKAFRNEILEGVKEIGKRQKPDGSWAKEAIYKAGRSELYFGSKVITTVFALCALKAVKGINRLTGDELC